MNANPHDEQDDRSDEERTAHEREQLLTTTTAALVRKREQLAAAEQCLEQTQKALSRMAANFERARDERDEARAEHETAVAERDAVEAARKARVRDSELAQQARVKAEHELCVTRETLRLTAQQRDYFDSKAAKAGAELDTARETLRELTALAERATRGATDVERQIAASVLVATLVRPRAAVEDVALEAAKRGAA